MCVYSNVLDRFEPLFPQPWHDPPDQPMTPPPPSLPVYPATPVKIGDLTPGTSSFPWWPQVDLSELRQLIDDFKEAMKAAKTVDKIVGHADCESEEKLKLVARVQELEKLLKERESAGKTYYIKYVSMDTGYQTYKNRSSGTTYVRGFAMTFLTLKAAREALKSYPPAKGWKSKIVSFRYKTK